MTGSALSCRALTVRLGGAPVLNGLDIEIAMGETLALLGPSGSGKTTLLYAIAGLIAPESGTIEIGGVPMTRDVGPERRSIGMVFQNYALWPHLTASRTVAYPLERRGISRSEAMQRAAVLLELVGIGELGDRLPDQLSGGQQQRVGLARALAAEPALYLFDEPTAHLDAGVRESLQTELVAQRTRNSAATLYTTHDAAEALAVADRIAILREGRIVQVDAPEAVYARPVDVWTAGLTGPVSVIDGSVMSAVGSDLDVEVAGTVVRVAGGSVGSSGPVRLVVRPDWALLGGPLRGTVAAVRYDGPHTDYTLATAAGNVRIRRAGPPALRPGDTTGWALAQVWALPVEPV